MKNNLKKFNEYSINEHYAGDPFDGTNGDAKRFIKEFLDNLNNPFMMSMFGRMLETKSFIKFGQVVYDLTDEEKEKLQGIIPIYKDIKIY